VYVAMLYIVVSKIKSQNRLKIVIYDDDSNPFVRTKIVMYKLLKKLIVFN